MTAVKQQLLDSQLTGASANKVRDIAIGRPGDGAEVMIRRPRKHLG